MTTAIAIAGFALLIPLLFAAALAWCIVIWRRGVGRGVTRAFAMINQVLSVTPTKTGQLQFPAAVTVAGVPLLVSTIPCVPLDAYQATIGGATVYYDGCYSIQVFAVSSFSPTAGKQISLGDPIYLVGGTYDAATNVVYGGVLCADSTGDLFGYLDPGTNSGPMLGGTNAVVNVRLASKF